MLCSFECSAGVTEASLSVLGNPWDAISGKKDSDDRKSGMNKNKNRCQFEIFGIHVGISSFSQSSKVIRGLIEKKTVSCVCIINVHVLVTAMRDYRFHRILNAADWSFPDGVPLVWYARHILGLHHVERVAGPSLMNKCFQDLKGVKHFFYGSTDATLQQLVAVARQRYPHINIGGHIAPPFRPLQKSEKKEICASINEISPDIIWVCLGAPKQEKWMWEMRNEIKRGVMIGVGAAFDYFVGNIKRPPVWIRRSGLEWLCRLYQDPIRLSKRYVMTNTLFLYFLARELILSRHEKSRRRLIP